MAAAPGGLPPPPPPPASLAPGTPGNQDFSTHLIDPQNPGAPPAVRGTNDPIGNPDRHPGLSATAGVDTPGNAGTGNAADMQFEGAPGTPGGTLNQKLSQLRTLVQTISNNSQNSRQNQDIILSNLQLTRKRILLLGQSLMAVLARITEVSDELKEKFGQTIQAITDDLDNVGNININQVINELYSIDQDLTRIQSDVDLQQADNPEAATLIAGPLNPAEYNRLQGTNPAPQRAANLDPAQAGGYSYPRLRSRSRRRDFSPVSIKKYTTIPPQNKSKKKRKNKKNTRKKKKKLFIKKIKIKKRKRGGSRASLASDSKSSPAPVN